MRKYAWLIVSVFLMGSTLYLGLNYYSTNKKLADEVSLSSTLKAEKKSADKMIKSKNDSIKLLKDSLTNSPNAKIILNAYKKKQEAAAAERAKDTLIKEYHKLNFSVAGIKHSIIPDENINKIFNGYEDEDNFMMATSMKETYNNSELLRGLIKDPKAIKKLYFENKLEIKILKMFSSRIQRVYSDKNTIIKFFDNSSTLEEKAFDNFFFYHDGQSIPNGTPDFIFSEDGKIFNNDNTGATLLKIYKNDKEKLVKDYKYYLLAKRCRKEFGDEWMKTVVEILRDL